MAIVVGLTSSFRAVSSSIASSGTALGLAVALHAWDLQMSLTGREKWRELQITSEYTEYKSTKLLKAEGAEPPTLNKSRDTQPQTSFFRIHPNPGFHDVSHCFAFKILHLEDAKKSKNLSSMFLILRVSLCFGCRLSVPFLLP